MVQFCGLMKWNGMKKKNDMGGHGDLFQVCYGFFYCIRGAVAFVNGTWPQRAPC